MSPAEQLTEPVDGDIVVVGLSQLAEDLEVVGQHPHLASSSGKPWTAGTHLALRHLHHERKPWGHPRLQC